MLCRTRTTLAQHQRDEVQGLSGFECNGYKTIIIRHINAQGKKNEEGKKVKMKNGLYFDINVIYLRELGSFSIAL